MSSDLFLLLVLCLTVTDSLCALPNDARVKALLQNGIHRGYPGVAFLAQSADGRIRSAAVGYSDLEKHIRLRVDDAFHMASINKTFTAVALLRLVDEQKLSLNATLKECLGDAVARIPNAERITVSQLSTTQAVSTLQTMTWIT